MGLEGWNFQPYPDLPKRRGRLETEFNNMARD